MPRESPNIIMLWKSVQLPQPSDILTRKRLHPLPRRRGAWQLSIHPHPNQLRRLIYRVERRSAFQLFDGRPRRESYFQVQTGKERCGKFQFNFTIKLALFAGLEQQKTSFNSINEYRIHRWIYFFHQILN